LFKARLEGVKHPFVREASSKSLVIVVDKLPSNVINFSVGLLAKTYPKLRKSKKIRG